MAQIPIRALSLALVGATIAVLTEAGMAATITVHAPDGEGRVFVDVVGKINGEDFKAFKEKTDQIFPIGAAYPQKQMIVTLTSPGGSINSAVQIGDQVRKRGMSTFVPGDRKCTSACALIWLAGVPRTVGDYPQIGFHAAYDPTTRQESGVGNAVVGAYLRDLGLSYKAIVFMTRKGPTSVEWLTPDLAKELGVGWVVLQPPRTIITIPPQPKLQPHQQPPPAVIAAWSKSARSLAQQQLPTATAPASPKAVTTSPEPVPQDAVRTPTQQPAAEKTQERFEPGSEQAAITPGTQQSAVVAQKVVLYEEDPTDPNGKRYVGSAIWRTETVTARLGQPPGFVIRADIEVPERKLAMTFLFRRNTDKALPATHTVEIMFKLPVDFATGGISNVPGILMKQGESTRGVPLAGLSVKVTPGFYMVGLSNQKIDTERNLQLVKERGWFDIPVVYNNNRRAILAIEKGPPGQRAFADAFTAWAE